MKQWDFANVTSIDFANYFLFCGLIWVDWFLVKKQSL